MMSGYRYGPYHDGPDPLEPPYDVRGAVDALGESVLDGSDPSSALRDLLRRGMSGQQARALLDTAVGQERAELFPDPADDARLREAELDALPGDTAQAIRQLADYDWRSPAARQTFEKLKDLLRREVLDSQFRGMKQTLQQPDPAAM